MDAFGDLAATDLTAFIEEANEWAALLADGVLQEWAEQNQGGTERVLADEDDDEDWGSAK